MASARARGDGALKECHAVAHGKHGRVPGSPREPLADVGVMLVTLLVGRAPGHCGLPRGAGTRVAAGVRASQPRCGAPKKGTQGKRRSVTLARSA